MQSRKSKQPWMENCPQPTPLTPHLASFCLLVLAYCHHASSLAFVCLVNSACLHTLSFVTYFSQSQTHAQSRNIIGHLRTHSSSHNTIGQCLLYNMSHTAVSLVLHAVDKGLCGRNILQSLLLIQLCICSQSIRPNSACVVIITISGKGNCRLWKHLIFKPVMG